MKKLMKPEILVPLVIVIGILGFLLIGDAMNKGASHGHSHDGGETHSH